MRARRLLLLGFAYLAFDLADPALPGAFSFEVRDSEIEEAVHTQRRPEDRQPVAARPAPPERRVGPRDDSFALQHRAAVRQPRMEASPPHPAPRSALLTPAPSPDDH